MQTTPQTSAVSAAAAAKSAPVAAKATSPALTQAQKAYAADQGLHLNASAGGGVGYGTGSVSLSEFVARAKSGVSGAADQLGSLPTYAAGETAKSGTASPTGTAAKTYKSADAAPVAASHSGASHTLNIQA